MRLLFTCRQLTGHLYPLLPLAEAATEAGHRVAFATGEPALTEVRARGWTAFPAAPDPGAREDFLRAFPQLLEVDPEEHRALFFSELFVRRELPARLAALTAIVAAWRPDAIVNEVAEYAGPIAATAEELPYVTAGYGPLVQPSVAERAAEATIPFWDAAGVEPVEPRAYLDPCPRSLQIGVIGLLPALPVRLTPLPLPRPGPAPIPLGPHARTVYVTFGTVWNRDAAPFRAAFDALADVPVNVVATLGGELDLGPVPANVSVHRFIPQAELLPHCDAVIAHGGAGTTLGALAHGLPLILLPQGGDQHYNAERAARAGAALVGTLDVTRLLEDDVLRAAAQRVAAELAALPDPAEVVERIVDICA
jgi:UDP:flavonoid glycosyltransferase YjiC (YdhE family)